MANNKNFVYSTVATAPSPATSGTSLTVQAGDGAKFVVGRNAVIWPANKQPLDSDAEIVTVTAVSTDTLTITRTQESTSARTVIVGDQIAQAITAKAVNDLEADVASRATLAEVIARTEITVGKTSDCDFYTGDYASDDLALQAAIDSLPTGFSGGAAIKIRRGVYDFVTGVVVPSAIHNLKLSGEGPSTIIRWKNGNTFTVAAVNTNWLITATSYCIITDLQLVGNSTFACPINGINTFNAGGGTNIYGGGILINAARHWIDRVYITGMAEDGITNQGGIGTKYGEVEIIGCGGAGLNITSIQGPAGNYATDADYTSVWIGSCGTGIIMSQGGSGISGAHVWGCQGDGLKINADSVRVYGGYYETNGGWGVNINGRTRSVIVANDIWANGLTFTTGNPLGGIGASGASKHNIIVGNHLRDNRYYGLLLTGTAAENTVSGNVVTDSYGRDASTGSAVTYTASASLSTNTTFTDANNPGWITSSSCIGMTLVITGAGVAGATLTTQVTAWSNPSAGVYNVTLATAMSTATTNPTYSVHAVAYGIREQSSATNNTITGNVIHRFDVQLGQIALSSVSSSNSSSHNNSGVDSRGWFEAGTVSGSALSPDVRSGGVYHATLANNITSVTFFPSSPLRNAEIVLILTQDGTGSRTVTGWPASVKFAGGSAPRLSVTAAATDVISFRYDGTNWLETGRSIQDSSPLTGTANQVIVTNGDGVAGPPTFSLPQDIATSSSPTFGGVTLNGNAVLIGTAAWNATMGRAASGAGQAMTIQAGGAQSGATDTAGGNLILAGGISTGSGASNIDFHTASGSSGTTDRTPSIKMRLQSSANGRLIIGPSTSITTVDGLNLVGTSAMNVQNSRHTTSNTAGNSLTVSSGGATSAATDKASGDLILKAGASTGIGASKVRIQTNTAATATGTSDNTATDRIIATSPKSITNNSATTLFSMTLASGSVVAGRVSYTVEVTDGTDFQYESGVITFGVTNKGGTIANNVTAKFGNQQAATAGTLTCTWTITAANPALIQLNANSSLTPSTGYPRVTCVLENLTQQAVAVS